MIKRKVLWASLMAAGLAAPMAHATDGYFQIGYGQKAHGMGGVGVALPQDALAAATNPAGMVLVGDRTDMGVTWFRPQRQADINGNTLVPSGDTGGSAISLNGSYDGNSTENFLIPEFGINRMINDSMSLGVSVYGNGGMNTDYATNPFNGLAQAGCFQQATGTGGPGLSYFTNNCAGKQLLASAGVNLMQAFVVPTWAMKLNQNNAIGVSLNLAWQQFEAKGLQPFAASPSQGGMSQSYTNVTNNGKDDSYGAGIKLGWNGQVTKDLSLGATYQSRTKMSKFSKYSGLFADQGSFDIPATFGVGMALKATPQTTVAFDVQRIEYSSVSSIGNPLSNLFTNGIGGSGSAGFGWRDINAYKLGVSHVYDSTLTLRAGYDHSDQPVPQSQTFFNMLAPGIVQDHITLGATWKLKDKSEITVAYVHAFSQTVNGVGSIPAQFGGGNANLTMHEDSIGIGYGW
jgi:long-chain fatty acid transport protein